MAAALKSSSAAVPLTTYKFTVAWSVPDVRHCTTGEYGTYIASDRIIVPADADAAWTVRVYPSGDCRQCLDNICVHLALSRNRDVGNSSKSVQTHELTRRAWFKVSLPYYNKSLVMPVNTYREQGLLECVGSSCVLPFASLKRNHTSLAIEIEVEVLVEQKANLWGNCRIVLDYKGATYSFYVSEAVLCSASPVLCAAFNSPMLEGRNRVYRVCDIAPHVLEAMLQYMHVDAVPQLESWVKYVELLAAAERFQIEGLKEKCELVLKEAVNRSTFYELVTSSDYYRVNGLFLVCAEYLAKNRTEMLNSGLWCDFMKQDHVLSAKLLYEAMRLI